MNNIVYQPGDVVQVKITHIHSYGAFCEIGDAKGLIHISEISDYFVEKIDEYFKKGDLVDVEVLAYNSETKQLRLSFKSIRPELLKNQGPKKEEANKVFDNLKTSLRE